MLLSVQSLQEWALWRSKGGWKKYQGTDTSGKSLSRGEMKQDRDELVGNPKTKEMEWEKEAATPAKAGCFTVKSGSWEQFI